mmetsp:Transcript_26164/g.26400  ORF Transcript_26164/g.26400 Transcript_26164/m.26400 type:complete len:233 (+) Transcript_26164:197-895(+)|eukprot:CAMPEP_0182429098 /NCGR_PEP_ID=MMETSP1167-20130531/25516_1 /TAXON_ID=2988 /ORGANISM="Mallomonas Sp, Strain CCMP3275" /LENGTH=232 /DNA_ID=CAMNT_0024612433 /DNA_START=162 /DNA_END=860 /DNA_ORIENTATION=+
MGACLNIKPALSTAEAKYTPDTPDNVTPVAVPQTSAAENISQTTVQNEGVKFDFRTIHSAIRWNKKPMEEIRDLIPNADAANSVDSNNGNTPIHIASQNGHLNLVEMLIEKGADVNLKNKKGNTALHMALSYDYYDCCLALLSAKADENIKNDAGFPAKLGLDGDKSIPLLQLLCSQTGEDVTKALNTIKANPEGISQASFAATGLKTKKELKTEWTDEIQNEFKAIFATFS